MINRQADGEGAADAFIAFYFNPPFMARNDPLRQAETNAVALLLLGGAGVIPIAIGFFLFIIGCIISVFLYNRARKSEA